MGKETKEELLTSYEGAFREKLIRNNSKIREDRADAIIEATEMHYKRNIEDNELKLKQLKREREAMMDLSPTTADSLVLSSDFDSDAFVKKDIEIGIRIRNLEISLEIAKERYIYLFKNK
jgi:hypothetical protein